MIERCPCCNARLRGVSLCPRCRTDLGNVLTAEQSARYWLAEAVRLWLQSETEQSLEALERSVQLQNNDLTLTLRDFFIDRLCRDVLDLLAQRQVLMAKQKLYRIRCLFPGNELLRQLNAFTDYLWVRN